jgi:hypothetical protein
MRLALIAALAAIALTLPPGASAQIAISPTTDIPVDGFITDLRISGSMTVDFHGDAAAGCASVRLCGVSGTVTWRPAGPASLFGYSYREGGKRYLAAVAIIGDEVGERDPIRSTARVRRAGANGAADAVCTDLTLQQFSAVPVDAQQGTSLELRVIGLAGTTFAPAEILRTRCAGPMTRDVSGLLPAHSVTVRTLLRGHRTLDYSADRSFSAHGLTGTVHSTVKVHILRGQRFTEDEEGRPAPGARRIPMRAIDVTYRVEEVSGQIATDVTGLADPDLCGPLDACGLMGSVTVAPKASAGEAHLFASASIRHSRHDLRRALGLAGGGHRPRDVLRYGIVVWPEQGSIHSELARDGLPDCTDDLPLTVDGDLGLEFSGNRVRASYGNSLFGDDPVKTRCPGPSGADVTGGASFATAAIPLSAFRHSRVTLHLGRSYDYTSDGYSGSAHPDVTVVLRRTRVREYIDRTYVAGDNFGQDFPPGVRPIR